MANTGSSVNVGGQVVSIYKSQVLSSVFGNETLYGVLQPGVADAIVSLSSDVTNLYITIHAGTKLFFQRSNVHDPIMTSPQQHNTILGKVILMENAVLTFKWADLSASSTKLYIVADWVYPSATDLYATFLPLNDTNITSGSYIFSGSDNQVLIATLLNNKNACTNTDSSYYHIAYEEQPNRNSLPRLYSKNDKFLTQFSGDAAAPGVYVSSGTTFSGSTILTANNLASPTWNGSTTYGGINYTNLISPASAITSYISDSISGATINITGSESSYCQVDFLRVKTDENTHTAKIVWESFLRLNVSPVTPLSFPATPSTLLAYLTQQIANPIFEFPLQGDGFTIMAMVRRCNHLSTDFWPENSILFEDLGLPENAPVQHRIRQKLPTYSAADLGLS